MAPNNASFGIDRWGVHLFAWIVLAATLLLICSGGLVTSKGVGMAVPDWPTTYGYNMFLFPVSKWVGGIFYEHTHRLLASGVGLLTVLLAIWLLVVESRRWVKILGAWAVLGVVVQGVLGGLRVTMFKDEIGIFHGVLAQIFLCTIATIVLVTSPVFCSGRFFQTPAAGKLRWFALALVLAIFVQLGIGASMRHAHSGLAIPDFPLAYSQVWPDTDAETITAINEVRRSEGIPLTSAGQIHLQMSHRLLAYGILIAAGIFFWKARKSGDALLGGLALLWLGLLLGQGALGAWTIWSDKAADVATSHVFLGAVCLLCGIIIVLRQFFSLEGNRARSFSAPHTDLASPALTTAQ